MRDGSRTPGDGHEGMPHVDASRVYWDISMLPYAARREPSVPDAEPDDDSPQARAFHEAFVAPLLGPRLAEVPEYPRTVYSFIGKDGQEIRAEFNAQENYWTWGLESFTQGPDEIWHRSAFVADVPIQYLSCFERSLDCVELALREPGMFDWLICRFTSGSRYDAWLFASVGVRDRRKVVRYREVVGKHFDPSMPFPFEADARDIPHLRACARAIRKEGETLAARWRTQGLRPPRRNSIAAPEFFALPKLGAPAPPPPEYGLRRAD